MALPHNVLFDAALPYYVADSKGFFKDEGLNVQPTFTKGGATNVQAVVSGAVDIGIATGTFALFTAFAKDAPVQIIASDAIGTPDLFWYAKGDAKVNSIEDLAGKKVGFSERGSSTDMAVLAMADLIKAKGLKPPEGVPAGSPPDNFTAVKTGQIDAGWSVPPFFLENVQKGEIKIVARGSQLTALNTESVRADFANTNFLKQHPDEAKKFMSAYAKGLKFIFSNQAESIKIWKDRAKLTESDSVLKQTFDYYPPAQFEIQALKGVDLINKQAVDFKFLDKALTKDQLDKLIVSTYLPK